MSDSELNFEFRAAMDPGFNGLIIEGFLCGMYTLLLAQALWKLTKKGKKGIYSCALTMLWIFVMLEFAGDWVITRNQFALNNDSPLEILIGQDNNPSMTRLSEVALVGIVLFSDSILIWRCNVLWKNMYIFVTLIMLLVATIGLTISNYVVDLIGLPIKFGALLTASRALVTCMTAVSATSLIVLKIVLVTRKSRMGYSYKKTIEILVESAALTSIGLLSVVSLTLLSYVHPFQMGTASGRICYQVVGYFSSFQGTLSGISPTLIAFRVAEELSHRTTNSTKQSNHLSHLTFRRTAHSASDNSDAPDTSDLRVHNTSSHGREDITSTHAFMNA